MSLYAIDQRPPRAATATPRWDLYDECVEVAKKSWQATSRSGNTLCSPRVSDYLRDSHAAAARLGMVDINLLRIDGRSAAFVYNVAFDGRLEGVRMGFDRSFRREGVGGVLLEHMIRDSIARGDWHYEFGLGDETYKQRLRTDTETTRRLTYGSPAAWKPRAVSFARWLRQRVGPAA